MRELLFDVPAPSKYLLSQVQRSVVVAPLLLLLLLLRSPLLDKLLEFGRVFYVDIDLLSGLGGPQNHASRLFANRRQFIGHDTVVLVDQRQTNPGSFPVPQPDLINHIGRDGRRVVARTRGSSSNLQ